MKYIDVTLRDGGFVSDFNWDFNSAKQHIKTMCAINSHIIELGYWRQNSKSQNPFYNMNLDVLRKLEGAFDGFSKCAAMIDYHYCSHDMKDYPKFGESRLDMLRLTSRKEDFLDALKFAEQLKIETDLDISFQVINSTNYSKEELLKVTKKICQSNVDVVAYADSHGNLNLFDDYFKYEPALDELRDSGVKTGFHLHNHTGRALSNYLFLCSKSIDYMDASVNGVGKGLGNLKYEEIVRNEDLPILLEYMCSGAHDALSINNRKAYNIVTGRANVTDNYSKQAFKNKIPLSDFSIKLSRLHGKDRDSYNPDAFLKIK